MANLMEIDRERGTCTTERCIYMFIVYKDTPDCAFSFLSPPELGGASKKLPRVVVLSVHFGTQGNPTKSPFA